MALNLSSNEGTLIDLESIEVAPRVEREPQALSFGKEGAGVEDKDGVGATGVEGEAEGCDGWESWGKEEVGTKVGAAGDRAGNAPDLGAELASVGKNFEGVICLCKVPACLVGGLAVARSRSKSRRSSFSKKRIKSPRLHSF